MTLPKRPGGAAVDSRAAFFFGAARPPSNRCALLLSLALWQGVAAAPFRPESDAQVLETLPARLASANQRELRELHKALAADPNDLALAVKLARLHFEQVAADGDPRHVGQAQAALAPWWDQPQPPPQVRLLRAMLRQFGHEFDAARVDLLALLREHPDNGEAWAWLAAISLVQADYATARQACRALAPLASALIGAACLAQVESLTGHSAAAAATLRAALRDNPRSPPAEQLWALTRLGEAAARHGDTAGAEAAFRRALALDIEDGYLLAAYADLLLDLGRPAEVLALLRPRPRSDLLLLRLALAADAAHDPAASAGTEELAARFDAARQRGNSLHEKEESRFALALLKQPARALALARSNFRLQREPADARALLEAALAADAPDAATPALDWLAASGNDGVVLHALARRLKAAK